MIFTPQRFELEFQAASTLHTRISGANEGDSDLAMSFDFALWKYITVCFRKFHAREMDFDQASKYEVPQEGLS